MRPNHVFVLPGGLTLPCGTRWTAGRCWSRSERSATLAPVPCDVPHAQLRGARSKLQTFGNRRPVTVSNGLQTLNEVKSVDSDGGWLSLLMFKDDVKTCSLLAVFCATWRNMDSLLLCWRVCWRLLTCHRDVDCGCHHLTTHDHKAALRSKCVATAQ